MIYVHVPFCRSFCTYCDFYSEILARPDRACECMVLTCDGAPETVSTNGRGPILGRGSRPRECEQNSLKGHSGGRGVGDKIGPRPDSVVERYTDELCGEIDARREEIHATLGLNTLYIGGGTPSVLPLPALRRIVEALSEVSGVPVGPAGADGVTSAVRRYEEFTIEVNPEDIVERGPEFVRGLLDLGVTRISMGVQSLDDGVLRWMNRRHDAAHARKAWRILREASEVFPPSHISGGEEQKGAKTFPPPPISGRGKHLPACSLSVDLITGVPGMTEETLSETLKEIIEWRPDHISAYQLSIEEGSALADLIASGKVSELPEEQCRAQYEMVCRELGAAGYEHYEISNWCLPGKRSKHNSAYWKRLPYVGIGPGAHSLGGYAAVPANSGPSAASLGVPPLIYPGAAEAVAPCASGPSAASLGVPPLIYPGAAEAVLSHGSEGGPAAKIRSWNSKVLSGWQRECETLTAEEIREERIMLGLRTSEGIDPGLIASCVKEEIRGKGSDEKALPDGLTKEGSRIRIPESSWFIADEIIADLF